MYAIAAIDGRQVKVQPGAVLDISRIEGDPDNTVTVEDCILFAHDDNGITQGNPVIKGSNLELDILEHYRGTKKTVFKMKRRKRYRRKKGHRQEMTRVRVKNVSLKGGSKSSKTGSKATQPAAEPATTDAGDETSEEASE